MLRKRSRPFQKEHSRRQLMADLASDSSLDNVVHRARAPPFFAVPGLFVGLNAKAVDPDSARSPTSPLDYIAMSPRSPRFDAQLCNRVGLGLIDSLSDGKALGSSESRSVLFGSQLKIQTPTNPKPHLDSLLNSPKFEIGSVASDPAAETAGPSSFPRVFSSSSELKAAQLILSGSLPIPISNGLIGSLSASEIELSEDYTCIISHGPNPKTTHIFGDCILDSETIKSLDCKNNKNVDASLPSNDFLSRCFSCKKKLEQGEDIYMYR